MHRMLVSCALFGALVVACGPAAAQSVGLAQTAMDDHKSVSLHNWRFDRLRDVGELRIKERCKGISFRQAECRLLEVDGAPPDDKALKRYEKSTPQPVEENLPNIDPEQFVNSATLALAERDGAYQSFTFDGAADSPDEYEEMGRQKGTLLVHREEGHIHRLSVRNSETFKPAFGIKIKKMAIDIEFVRVGEDVFASSVSMIAEGKAGGIKSIGQNQKFEFRNFTPPQ